nr:hypothetical protein [Providencia alcalifaciens]
MTTSEKVDEYECTDAALSLLCDTPNSLWDNNNESGGGINDQVSPQEAQKINESLYFIYVEKLTIDSSKWDNKLKLRGEFVYNNTTYNLKITDIYWLDYYENQPLGKYIHDNAYITISLALDTFGGFHYKLIADILLWKYTQLALLKKLLKNFSPWLSRSQSKPWLMSG